MIEILVISWLSKVNRENAIWRGRKPGLFIALTWILWFAMELLGFSIGSSNGMELGAYFLGLVFAGFGGLFAYLIAKNCRKGDYVPKLERMIETIQNTAEALAEPATIEIIRRKSFVGALAVFPLTLNGHLLPDVRNGKTITVQTNQKQNILNVTDAFGHDLKPFIFDIASGGYAKIQFKAGKFLPKTVTGVLPPTSIAEPVK